MFVFPHISNISRARILSAYLERLNITVTDEPVIYELNEAVV